MRALGVTLIEVTDSPVEDGISEIQNGSYPTGHWCIVKLEAANRMFNDLGDNRVVLIDRELYRRIIVGGDS